MSQPDRQLEQLTAVLRDLNPELDELARARILARTNAAIDAGAHGGGSSRKRVRVLAAGGVLLAAAAALLLVLQPWRAVESAPSARVRVPDTRSAAHERANPARTDAPLTVVTPAPSARAVPELVPYSISGARGRSLAGELGKPLRALEIPAGTSARATVGAAVRLSLVGPARIELADASDERVELMLARGQVAIDFAGGNGRQLLVRTAQANVRVVGTRFAVVAEAQDTRVGVEEGTVEVARGERAQWLTAGRAWRARTGAESALAGPLRALLRSHRTGLQPPPSAHGLLSIEGDGRPVRARLADQLLGLTPVWALVPVGPVTVSLDAAGARSVLRTEVAASGTTALALKPAASAAPTPSEAPPRSAGTVLPEDAAALYRAAERALRDGDRVAAQRALERLIARFPRSAQAEPALYELAQLAASCAEQRPLLERYLAQYAHGRFAAGARERLTRCSAQP